MNGELYQLARLVLYAKDSLQREKGSAFILLKYENSPVFSFLERKENGSDDTEVCLDAASWCRALQKRGLRNIYLVVFYTENNRYLSGFSNAEKQGIVTEYTDGRTTLWTSRWQFDKAEKEWMTYYTEERFDPSGITYIYENCREDFETVLLEIRDLARKIGHSYFERIFADAYDILTGPDEPAIPEWAKETMPELKGESLRLFLAASRADVFGGMGSWNDDPSGMADQKGLKEEYDRLSNALYTSIKKAVMNVVNGQ